MPIFEFRCKKCGHLEEVLQKYDDPAPNPCPSCGAKKSLEKEVSLTSFQLKGGGWYSDLYSSVKKDDGGSKDGASSEKGDGGSSGDKKADTPAKADKKATASVKAGGDQKKKKKTSNG